MIEVTLRTPGALDAIRAMSKVEGAVVGAGTVLNERMLGEAIDAGASFIVSPGLTDRSARRRSRRGVPYLPGVATAGDIMRGLDLGLDRFKFFPAEAAGGLPALKALAAPFGEVRFCPTGGITRGKRAAMAGASLGPVRRRKLDRSGRRDRPRPHRRTGAGRGGSEETGSRNETSRASATLGARCISPNHPCATGPPPSVGGRDPRRAGVRADQPVAADPREPARGSGRDFRRDRAASAARSSKKSLQPEEAQPEREEGAASAEEYREPGDAGRRAQAADPASHSAADAGHPDARPGQRTDAGRVQRRRPRHRRGRAGDRHRQRRIGQRHRRRRLGRDRDAAGGRPRDHQPRLSARRSSATGRAAGAVFVARAGPARRPRTTARSSARSATRRSTNGPAGWSRSAPCSAPRPTPAGGRSPPGSAMSRAMSGALTAGIFALACRQGAPRDKGASDDRSRMVGL